ncbi:pyridoxal phosphate-dependent aminotransferase [Streptomyces sp. 4N509B]|uniref:pyridoxal phosphate-dependent aminotransferase n=1 Tax=Streptomyces sp. 4N509B TaxID=3457413 RepID=UPI003FD59BC5
MEHVTPARPPVRPRVPGLSATLAVNEALRARRAAGLPVLNLGFGEAGLPVPDGLATVLARAARLNGYAPVAGTPEAREAAAGWFARRGLPTHPEQLVLAPGSKPLLYALLAALPGDVVLPRPAWVSYAAQAALAGRRVISVPVPAEAGGVPDPDLLQPALANARAAGAEPGVLVLTVPDNPTGTVASADHVRRVCDIAERHGLALIADEIYAELVHDHLPDQPHPALPRAVTHLPDRTVITTGLSKSLALGGWRVGFARLPRGPWGRRLTDGLLGVASELWSALATPLQAVAAHVLADPPEIVDHVAAGRALHAAVARAVHAEFLAVDARCRPPRAGFYLYPELPWDGAGADASADAGGGAALAAALLERHGVGVLPGEAFGDDPATPRVRVATGLLYGETDEQRWQALRAADPLALPWIADALAHLRRALRAVTSTTPETSAVTAVSATSETSTTSFTPALTPPAVSGTPASLAAPGSPAAPEAPASPGPPGTPASPGTPTSPGSPAASTASGVPASPAAPGAPASSTTSGVPASPLASGAPASLVAPGTPASSVASGALGSPTASAVPEPPEPPEVRAARAEGEGGEKGERNEAGEADEGGEGGEPRPSGAPPPVTPTGV